MVSPFASSRWPEHEAAFCQPVSVLGHVIVGPLPVSDALHEPAFCAPVSLVAWQRVVTPLPLGPELPTIQEVELVQSCVVIV